MTTTRKLSWLIAGSIPGWFKPGWFRPGWFKPSVVLLVIAAALFPLHLSGQVTTAPVIVIKQPKVKYDTYRGEVVNCTAKAITVRDPANVYNTRTFSFSPGLERKMENRSVDPGLKVTVKVQHASNVAVSLRGKKLKVSQ